MRRSNAPTGPWCEKYHPDNYVNNPLADLAEAKMKEINEAYDAIVKGRTQGGYQQQAQS